MRTYREILILACQPVEIGKSVLTLKRSFAAQQFHIIVQKEYSLFEFVTNYQFWTVVIVIWIQSRSQFCFGLILNVNLQNCRHVT